MSWRRSVGLIAGREMSTRMRTKSYIWTTVIMVVLVVAGVFVIDAVQGSTRPAQQVAVSAELEELEPFLVEAGNLNGIELSVTFSDDEAGRELVASGEAEAYVYPVAAGDGASAGASLNVVVQENLSAGLTTTFTMTAQQHALLSSITAVGGDPEEVLLAVAAAGIEVESLTEAPPLDGGRVLVGTLTGVLLFITILMCGQLIAMGVVEEKSSRVVGLLLATVRPWELMAGKVLGIGVVGLVQVGSVVVAGVVSANITGVLDTSDLNLNSTLGWALVWFILGYSVYSVLLAALASLVSRQEEVSSVISPVVWLLMVPYMVGVVVAPSDPNSTLITVVSLIPLFSPIMMPIRLALGTVELGEMLLALGLTVALGLALLWLSQRVYSNAITRTGSRIKLRDALSVS